MATFKGVVRSYGAAVRRAERDQQRRTRESAKKFKLQQKEQEIENAEQAVLDWENYVDTIKSLHINCTEQIDWLQIENSPKPSVPNKRNKNTNSAKERLERFKPSFLDKLFGSTEKKINRLTELLENAKSKDKTENDLDNTQYLEELNNWEELQEICSGIKERKTVFYEKALYYFDPFLDIGELGTQISFNFSENYIDLDLQVNSLDLIPNYELKQTSLGKLSKKDMPKTRFNELYQDHVCSASIRIAREIFAYLPVDYARINSLAKVVNTETGHLEDQPILSVIFLPETIDSLNLETIDPSDSMKNFVHNMNFSKTKGFSIIEKVEFVK